MWIIDRFEDDFAVIECGETVFNVPKKALPDGVSEGDVISLQVDRSVTENRKEQLNGKLKKLFGE